MRRAFWIVLVLAALIRIPGIFGEGFPETFYPDETNAIQRSLRFGAERTANPAWFNKPALAYYVWFAAYGVYYAAGHALGAFTSPEEFGVSAFARVAPFLVIGRVIATLFGIATVWLAYLLGKAVRDRTLGIITALALALTYAHVVTGQWVKEDVPCAFFHTAATVLLVSVLTRARVKDSAWAGLLGGLGMATKYYSVALMLPALFAHLFPASAARRGLRSRLGRFGLFVLAFTGGFFIGSPYNFIEPDFWVHQVVPRLKQAAQLFHLDGVFGSVALAQAPRTMFVDTAGTFSIRDVVWALAESLYAPAGAGVVFCGLAALGIVLALVRRRRRDAFVLVAFIGQALFIAVSNRQFSEPRHLVILYPLLAVLTADAVVFLAVLVQAVMRRQSLVGVAAALLLAFSLVPLRGPSVATMFKDRALEPLRGDTRIEALRWIEANLPANTTILNDHEVLPLQVNAARAEWARDRLRRSGGVWKYVSRWYFREKAGLLGTRPAYDVLVIEAPWGAESKEELALVRGGYDRTWPLDFVRHPATVAPVARYAEVPEAAAALLAQGPVSRRALIRAWPAAEVLVDAHPVAWLVSSELSYRNYEREKKRAEFPGRAAFYDDLAAHYDCYQWSPGPGRRTGPTIRIYDLRARVSREPVVREMSGSDS